MPGKSLSGIHTVRAIFIIILRCHLPLTLRCVLSGVFLEPLTYDDVIIPLANGMCDCLTLCFQYSESWIRPTVWLVSLDHVDSLVLILHWSKNVTIRGIWVQRSHKALLLILLQFPRIYFSCKTCFNCTEISKYIIDVNKNLEDGWTKEDHPWPSGTS